MLSSINDLFAATKAVLADKEHAVQAEYEARLADLSSSASPSVAVVVDRPAHYALGQVVFATSQLSSPSSITSLLYHCGTIVLTTSRGSVVALNALTFAVDASHALPSPITCACLTDAARITGHRSGDLYATPLSALPSLSPALLTSLPSPPTSLVFSAPLLHCALTSGHLHSLTLPSLHLTHSLHLSPSPLTALLPYPPSHLYVGDQRGTLHRLHLPLRQITSLPCHDPPTPTPADAAGGGGGGGVEVRALMASPSPAPKPKKKPGTGKASKEDDDPPPTDTDAGGPILVWAAHGAGRLRVWDTRDGRDSVVFDYQHVTPDAVAGVAASHALTTAAPSTSTPSTPAMRGGTGGGGWGSGGGGGTVPVSNAPSIIHALLWHDATLYTAHEERALGVLPLTLQPTPAGATRTLGTSGGWDMQQIQPPFRESVTHLLHVPPNPVRPSPSAPSSDPSLPSDSTPTPPSDTADPSPAPSPRGDGVPPPSSDPPPTLPHPTVPTAAAPFGGSSYLLAGTASGELHLFVMGALEREVEERRGVEAKRLEGVVDAWVEGRSKVVGGGKGKGGAGVGAGGGVEGKGGRGKGKRGEKGGDTAPLTVRDEQKETDDSAMTTARD